MNRSLLAWLCFALCAALLAACMPATPTLLPIHSPPISQMYTITPSATSSLVPPECTQKGQTWVSPIDGMTLVCVPAGEFVMGSDTLNSEKPIHTVYLDAFWFDQTEVTNAMFEKYIQTSGYQTNAEKEGGGWVTELGAGHHPYTPGADWQHPQGPTSNLYELEQHPVVQVSWRDAAAYCAWAERELPTEAEWEKAARGTDGRTYPWGEGIDSSRANYNQNIGATTDVGKYPNGASPYGAYDMAGNVWEWVSDLYGFDYYNQSPTSNPTGPVTGDYRVMRGGSWYFSELSLRSSSRMENLPTFRDHLIGFRCSKSAASP